MSNLLGITFRKLEQTCNACPSQWDAWDYDGTYYYIRYRWGHLTVSKGDVFGEDVYADDPGAELDGYMTTQEMLATIGCTYEPDED